VLEDEVGLQPAAHVFGALEAQARGVVDELLGLLAAGVDALGGDVETTVERDTALGPGGAGGGEGEGGGDNDALDHGDLEGELKDLTSLSAAAAPQQALIAPRSRARGVNETNFQSGAQRGACCGAHRHKKARSAGPAGFDLVPRRRGVAPGWCVRLCVDQNAKITPTA
jgi:hypothetical protein